MVGEGLALKVQGKDSRKTWEVRCYLLLDQLVSLGAMSDKLLGFKCPSPELRKKQSQFMPSASRTVVLV